jgi:hypothetical protein
MTANRRLIALAAVALVAGLAIGWNDSRPTWDDTGVTAGLLVVGGAVFGVLDPRRWWLWALLVGVGTPLFEVGGATGTASLAAFVFSGVGAAGGAGASRLLRSDRPRRGRRFESTPAELAGADDDPAQAGDGEP